MVVFECSEELECCCVSLSWIEEYDFVSAGVVYLLIAVQECARPEVWVDVAQSIKEYVRPFVFIHLTHVLHNPVVDMVQELITICRIEKTV